MLKCKHASALILAKHSFGMLNVFSAWLFYCTCVCIDEKYFMVLYHRSLSFSPIRWWVFFFFFVSSTSSVRYIPLLFFFFMYVLFGSSSSSSWSSSFSKFYSALLLFCRLIASCFEHSSFLLHIASIYPWPSLCLIFLQNLFRDEIADEINDGRTKKNQQLCINAQSIVHYEYWK